ncbi:MAG: HAD family hydrolase [Chloroflexota bacterium]
MAKTIEAVILDVDGTLVDSNDAHARAWCDVLREAGYNVSVEHVRRLIGMGSDKLLPRAAGVEKDSPEGERLSKRRKALFEEKYLARLKPTPGARDLLERFRSDGLTLIVASSAEKEELSALLDIVGAPELVDETTSSSDVSHSKPDPDIVEAAVQKFGGPRAHAVMLGDTPYDVDAAAGAGVGIIAVRCGGWSDADLHGALAIYDDPADVLAHYEASPLAR